MLDRGRPCHGSPRQVVLATPVAPPTTAAEMARLADAVVSVVTPSPFAAIGQWYRDFSATSDADVLRILDQFSLDEFGEQGNLELSRRASHASARRLHDPAHRSSDPRSRRSRRRHPRARSPSHRRTGQRDEVVTAFEDAIVRPLAGANAVRPRAQRRSRPGPGEVGERVARCASKPAEIDHQLGANSPTGATISSIAASHVAGPAGRERDVHREPPRRRRRLAAAPGPG